MHSKTGESNEHILLGNVQPPRVKAFSVHCCKAKCLRNLVVFEGFLTEHSPEEPS